MVEKIQKIIEGVNIPETVKEGIETALEKQDEIDKIQSTEHRTSGYLDARKTIEAGKEEIEKKIENEHKRKLLETQQANKLIAQKLRDERGGFKTLGVVEPEESKKVVAANMPQKALTEDEEAKQQLIIDYLDEVMQQPEFWTGQLYNPDEKPQKEEIELLERRTFNNIMGYLIRHKTNGKKFFVPDLQNLNKEIADKLPAAIKTNFKLHHAG